MLNVTKISKEFGKLPNEWFATATVKEFIKALIQIKIEAKDKKLVKSFIKFCKNNEITVTSKNGNGQNSEFTDIFY